MALPLRRSHQSLSGKRPTAWDGYTPHALRSLVAPLKHDRASMLRAALGVAINDAAARPFNEQAATWTVSKQEELLPALLHCINGSQPSLRLTSNGERARVIKAALAAINDQAEAVITVGNLCRSARARERTLHHAFIERFGLPPSQYMKAR